MPKALLWTPKCVKTCEQVLTRTNNDGHYDLGGLNTDTYRVRFEDQNGNYASEYYDNAPNIENATDITVTAGNTTSGIDAQLSLAGHITGTVTDIGGNPLENIRVSALYYYDDGDWDRVSDTRTNSEGHYDLGSLNTDIYTVRFQDEEGRYVTEYYDNAPTDKKATDVTVTAGSTTSNINAQLELGGHITGRVMDADGNPLRNIEVNALYFTGMRWKDIARERTNDEGYYDLGALNPGTYRLAFEDREGRYATEHYDDALSEKTAKDLTVTAGSTTSDIDAQLELGAHITGTVTDADGKPLENIEAEIFYWDGHWWDRLDYDGETDADGHYDISGLKAGTYRVQFWPDSTYAIQYFDNKQFVENATDVTVTTAETISNINAQLTILAGHIKGRITDIAGNPLKNIDAIASHWNGSQWQWFSGGQSDADGQYDIGALNTGTYRVEFWDNNEGSLLGYYDGASDIENATDIEVIAGETTEDINAQIDLVGSTTGNITGRVTDANGDPLENIEVSARYFNGMEWQDFADVRTNANGHYDLSGLNPGTYRVRFQDYHSQIYGAEYYDDVPDVESATDVTVTAGSTTSNIDAQLELGGKITGTVTDADGNPLKGINVGIFYWNGNWWDWFYVDDSTDSNGHYELSGLKSGTYRVRFMNDEGPYATEYYDDAPFVEKAKDVTVTAGETTSNIDAQFTVLAGHITGTITDVAGNPLQHIMAIASYWNGSRWQWISNGWSDVDGHYDLGSLNTGTYRVEFLDEDGSVLEYYDDAEDIDSATDIAVTAGKITPNINAQIGDPVSVPGKPVLQSPKDTITETKPTYTWNAVSTATDYQLWVNDANGQSVINTWYTASEANCASGTCSVTPTTVLTGDATWWVRAKNSAGEGTWSDAMTFSVSVVKPGKAALTAPSGAMSETKPVFTWEVVNSASYYYLWINGASGKLFAEWYKANDLDCTTRCQLESPITLENGGKYTWWIQTWNTAGYGPWSDAMTFTIDDMAAMLISPDGTTLYNSPLFTWKAVSKATWYYLWVNDAANSPIIKKWYTDDICDESVCEVGSPKTLGDGDYTWWIQTWNEEGYGPWSNRMTFNLTAPTILPDAAELVTPKGTISDDTPAYQWNAVNTSTWYHLWINDATGTYFNKWYRASKVCSEGRCQVELEASLENGDYTWWIQTWNSVGYGPWSQAMSFEVQ